MFCNKCGSKSLEGADFCSKCGAKLIKEETAVQPPVTPVATTTPTPIEASTVASSAPISMTAATGTYDLLKENASRCTAIKSVSLHKNGIFTVVKGKVNNYLVNVVNGKVTATATPMFPFNLPLAIIGFALAWIAANFGFGDFDFDEISLVLGLCLLIGGLSGAVVSVLGGKERKIILPHIYGVLNQTPSEEQRKPFPVGLVVFPVIALVGIIVLILGTDLLDDFGGGATEGPLLADGYDSTPKQQTTVGGKIMVGETQSFNNSFGNLEVTLDYVEFIDKIENTLFGGYIYPDEGNTFLRAVLTYKNIGTESGTLMTAWSTVVYDGSYEFRYRDIDGDFTLNPLAPPKTGSITFMVPNNVMEPDRSLVLNFDDGYEGAVMSFVIRTGDSASSGTGTDNQGGASNAENLRYEIRALVALDDNLYMDEYIPVIIVYEYPVFFGDTPLEKTLNEISANYQSNVKSEYPHARDFTPGREYTVDDYKNEFCPAGFEYPYEEMTLCSIYQRNGFISISTKSTFYYGGVYDITYAGNFSGASYADGLGVYDAATGWRLDVSDILKGSSSQQILNMLKSEFEKEHGELLNGSSEGSIFLSEEGFHYAPRDIYGYQRGALFTIPYSRIDMFNPSFLNASSPAPSASAGTGTANSSNNYPGEMLFEGQPIMNWMGASLASLRDVFGAPDVEGVIWEGGAYGYAYGSLNQYGSWDAAFVKAFNSEFIEMIYGWPAALTFDGITLDKNREGLIELFGEPEYDGWSDDYGVNRYYMGFIQQENTITFYMDDPNSLANEFYISADDYGISDEEYQASLEAENSSQQGGSQQSEGVYTLIDTTKKRSSSGNVYAAPLEFISSSMIGNVNILNPEKVKHGCKIQIVTGKNFLGMYESYTIDEDGMPGGTAWTVVDAMVID